MFVRQAGTPSEMCFLCPHKLPKTHSVADSFLVLPFSGQAILVVFRGSLQASAREKNSADLELKICEIHLREDSATNSATPRALVPSTIICEPRRGERQTGARAYIRTHLRLPPPKAWQDILWLFLPLLSKLRNASLY